MSKSDEIVVVAATSDIHGFLDGLEEEVLSVNPHILVIAGDINPCRIDITAHDWFENEFFPMVRRWANKTIHVVAIPGNHDFWLNEYLRGEVDIELPPNFHLLCDSQETIFGLRIYGTPWVPWINGSWCWEASNRTLAYEFSKIPTNLDILITHSPPRIPSQYVDISTQRPKESWRHFGSEELYQEIRGKNPWHLFCGHIHSGDHKEQQIECTRRRACRVHNVSRVDERYRIAYGLTTVRIKLADKYNTQEFI